MKPLRKSVPRHFHLLRSNLFPRICQTYLPQSSSKSQIANRESIDIHFSTSSNQPNSSLSDSLCILSSSTSGLSRIRLSNLPKEPRTWSSSDSRQLLSSPNFNLKTRSCDLGKFRFTQNRSFSDTISDPFPKPINPQSSSSSNSPSDSSQSIDAGSSMRKPISLWPGMYHSPVTNALWDARSRMFGKAGDVKPVDDNDSVSSSELVVKTPSKSRTSILYKFSSDYILREQYRNPWNEIRMGKLVEDLDALAGTISYKHCCSDYGRMRPIMLVTASVDRMVLKKPINIDNDLEISGAVTWVGRSSMEIQLRVIQSTQDNPNPEESVALAVNFTFVARDSKTGKSAVVNQIIPETEQEKLLWEEAEQRNQMRKKMKAENKRDVEKKDEEKINALLAEGRIFCDMPALADRDSILIHSTCHENSLICQPQQRNIHGRIFGGFLMRKAFELAFSNAYAFAGVAPQFVEVDHVDFFKPVDVGNFLRFKSCVLYTELENPDRPLINVEVIAHVTRPELRCSEVSNKFYFTFTIRPEARKNGLSIRKVVPATEEEARRVLERMDAETSNTGVGKAMENN